LAETFETNLVSSRELKIITDVQKITVVQKVTQTFFNDYSQLSHLQSNRSVGTTSFREREVTVRFKQSKPNMFLCLELHYEILPVSFSHRLAPQFLRYSLTNQKLHKVRKGT